MLQDTSLGSLLESEISKQRLPKTFLKTVEDFYLPLAKEIYSAVNEHSSVQSKPFLVGVYGSQGSGKSTFADFIRLLLDNKFATSCVVISLDDFYLTHKQRRQLAEQVHPLLQTRGVPGTHDMALLQSVINDLPYASSSNEIRIPTFDKATDDRADIDMWQRITHPPQVIILEGWCVGVEPQSAEALLEPVNQLEEREDSQGDWRRYVNQQLAERYMPIYRQIDKLIALVAPSFECVYEWRLLQELKLVDKLVAAGRSTGKTMTKEEIERFIAHYQRLTTHALATLPNYADWCLHINPDHQITTLSSAQNELLMDNL